MTQNFKRIAIVTGATSGIGESTARKFIGCGFGVVGNGRNKEKLHKLEKEMGTAFRGVTGDASDNAVLERLFICAREHFGRPADIVIANAGRGLGGSVKDADLSEFEDLLKINVTGTLYLLQKAARDMVELQEKAYPVTAADIVIIGSVVGRHISPFSSVYGATKYAVHALAEGLRREIGPMGVRVTLVEPGILLSRFQERAGYSDELVQKFHDKFGTLLRGDDVAEAIEYVVTRPAHVHVSDILVRPTGQDYP